MILDRHLSELLESCTVVARVFHAGFGEYCWHGARAHQTFLWNTGLTARAAEEAFAHLLNADS